MDTWYENNLPYYDLDSKLLSFRLFNHYLKLQSDSIFNISSFDLDLIETNPYTLYLQINSNSLQPFMLLLKSLTVINNK